MPLLMLKDVPRYECLLKAAELHPALDPVAHSTFMHLLRTADMVFAETGRFFSRHNVSQGRFTVLMLLSRSWESPSTPASLAEEAGVTRATMTGLIDTLEKDGLVVREPDAHDRRTTHVRITLNGQEFLGSMLPDHFERVSAMMQTLTKSECNQLVQLLQKIQEGLTPPEPTDLASPTT